jgi:hypothetical protein
LGDEPQGEAEARDDGSDAVDEPLGGGVVDRLEEHHEAEDHPWVVGWLVGWRVERWLVGWRVVACAGKHKLPRHETR